MPKLILLTLALASLSVVLACSDDEPAPAAQPAKETLATTAPEVTAPPTATALPTATPQEDRSEPAGHGKPAGAQRLTPLDMGNPQTFLSELSDGEQSCLADNDIGVVQVAVAMTSTDASQEANVIIDCFEDETVLRLFLSEPLTATGELSSETAACIREGLGVMDLRRMMKSTGAEAASMDAQIAGMASYITITSCLNDEEWAAAASALELGPRDQAGTDCLLAELGGTTGVAEALLRTDESGVPQAFIDVAAKCGVGFVGVSESLPADSGSGGISGDSSAEGMGLPPDALHPVAVDDPQAFLSGLSPRERSCLGDKGIDSRELSQMTGRSPGGSPESTADIINCLQDDTVLRLFLTSLVGLVEPFSEKTSICIREGFVPIDLRGLLAPAVAGFSPGNSLALSMVALNVSVVCMNDDEWAAYAPRLGMEPGDRDAAACLFEELGGPAKLVEAMQEASLGDSPEGLTRAWEACGLEDSAPPSQ